MLASTDVFVLPGLGSSGPAHWQTRWEQLHGFQRVEQASWDEPRRADWVACTRAAIDAARRPVVLVAHSLGAIMVAHLAPTLREGQVAAALLVAPADVEDRSRTPDVAADFAPIPRARLPFASCVVASRNDPFMPLARAESLARSWGAKFVDAGARGHINADSDLGDWPEGYALLHDLVSNCRR